MMEDDKTAYERPIKPNSFPRIPNKITKDPILTAAAKPTLVDFRACIFAVMIDESETGITVITIIWSAGMPSV